MKPKKLLSKLGAVVLSMFMILTNVDLAFLPEQPM